MHLPLCPVLGDHVCDNGILTSLPPSTQILQHAWTSIGGWMGGVVPCYPNKDIHWGITLHPSSIQPHRWTVLLLLLASWQWGTCATCPHISVLVELGSWSNNKNITLSMTNYTKWQQLTLQLYRETRQPQDAAFPMFYSMTAYGNALSTSVAKSWHTTSILYMILEVSYHLYPAIKIILLQLKIHFWHLVLFVLFCWDPPCADVIASFWLETVKNSHLFPTRK